MRKAVSYLRRSTDRQEQSIDDQRKFILAKAPQFGCEVVKEFVDDAVSGASAENREAFQEMIEFVESSSGEIKALLCYDISRFGRTDSDEAGYYRYRLKKVGCEVIYVAENLPNNRAGDLLRDVKQWQKREYLVDLSRDTIRGLVSTALKGFSTGRRAPYGYDRCVVSADGKHRKVIKDGEKVWKEKSDKVVLVPGDREKIKVVRGIFETYANEPHGIRTITDRLNLRGIPAPEGGKWNATTVASILRNPVYQGDMVYNRRAMSKFHYIRNCHAQERPQSVKGVIKNPEDQWIVKHHAHPALISRELFEKVQRKTKERAGHINKEIIRSDYFLPGLVYCGNCGAKMHGETNTRRKKGKVYRYRTYICSTYHSRGKSQCSANRLDSAAVEEAVLEEVKRELLPAEGKEELLAEIKKRLKPHLKEKRVNTAAIKRRIGELDARANLILDSITPENHSMVNSKLTALRLEKESLEKQLSCTNERKLEESNLESAAQKAYNLLLALKVAYAHRAALVLKELLRECVKRVIVTFRTQRVGRRIIHTPVGGVLELHTLNGVIANYTSPLNRGGGI